ADLAPALPVALAGEHRGPAPGLPDLAPREGEVDAREAVRDAVRGVLDAARVHDERWVRLPVHPSGRDDALAWHARQLLRLFRRVRLNGRAHLVPARGAFREVLLVDEVIHDQLAKDRVEDGEVCPRL